VEGRSERKLTGRGRAAYAVAVITLEVAGFERSCHARVYAGRGASIARVVDLEVVLFTTLPSGHRGLVTAETAAILEALQLAKRVEHYADRPDPLPYARRPPGRGQE
jgi:hypothetical protein